MVKARSLASRAADWIRLVWLRKECAMRFSGEQVGGASLTLWARRLAGAALIMFGLAVLISGLMGGR